MSTRGTKKLGQVLVEKGLITEAQLAEALRQQKKENRFLGAILVDQVWMNADQLLEALGEFYEMPCVRLREMRIDPAAVEQVPLKVALHYKVMPVRVEDTTLTVAISNPQDLRVLDELRLALQQRYTVEAILATQDDILQAVKRYYGIGAETVHQILTERASQAPVGEVERETIEDIERLAGDASVVKLVNQLILDAHTRRATDIHLEPYRGKVKFRYRIDGMLHNIDTPPAIRQLFSAIVSRVKVMCNLDIVERRLPQDGRASVMVGKEKLDLRIAILPTSAGESIDIRILSNEMLLDSQDLGFRDEDLQQLEQVIRKPYGLVLVTGPTGSGKTTTLYTCIKKINTEERKIITIEDPVEYELEGISQVQVVPPIGLTFASGLRSMLRHDPNVMMVGEVRDVETAELAIRAALTGHLVFSTLHTNDATSALIRLVDMGIDPYLIASCVECVIAQRLVRLVCPHCKVAVPSTRKEAKTIFQGRGCEQCQGTGFHGRSAIYELFVISEPIKDFILQKASADVIRGKAIEFGMRTMREDGWEKVRAGLTTPDEIIRVT